MEEVIKTSAFWRRKRGAGSKLYWQKVCSSMPGRSVAQQDWVSRGGLKMLFTGFKDSS